MPLLTRTVGDGRPFVRVHVKPPGSVRLLGVFLRGSCHRVLGKTWAVAHLNPRFRYPRGSRWVFDSPGRSLSVSFLDRVGYGSCLGLGCLYLRVDLSSRCFLGLRGPALGYERLFRTLGDFGFPSLTGYLILCLGRLELRLPVLGRLAFGRFLCCC